MLLDQETSDPNLSQAKTGCPLCRRPENRLLRVGIREDASRPVYECAYCGLVYLEPPFPDLRSYYSHSYRLTHSPVPGVILPPDERYQIQHQLMRKPALEFMKEVPEGASVLEIGCGVGGFLSHLVDKYDVSGSELNESDAAYVRDVGELPCEVGDVAEVYPGKTFTAIVALQVLEHQPDPMAFIRAIRSKLIGGGWLYLELPNIRDALLSMYKVKAYEDFYFREAHLTYWGVEQLAALLSTAGFESRISWIQRYSLHNHINWMLNGVPMDDPLLATRLWQPVDKANPGAAPLNRVWAELEKNYQIQMETLFCADTLKAWGRRQQI